jgi:hypothetical protein
MADWQPREAVRTALEARSCRLERIKIRDGGYEVCATDASRQRLEATVDPATLAILDIETKRRRR